MLTIFTDQNFPQETGKGFTMVDLYADWCGPCKMMAPIFDGIAHEYEGKVKMGKMNIDDNAETPGKFGVSSIPTIILLKDGIEVGRLVGFQSKENLVKSIKDSFGV